MDDVGRTTRLKRVQRTALALLVISGVVSYVDRATLSIASPMIREDLGLSIGEMGLLLSAFLWAYALSQIPTGALVDRLGARRLLALGLAVWSGAQMLGGLVSGFGAFFFARLLLGVGEAPQFPTGSRVVRDWFNLRHRGAATGIFISASTLGTALAAPLLTTFMGWFGWRGMFLIMGVFGFAIALLWYGLYRNPAEVALSAAEDRYLSEGDPTSAGGSVTLRQWRRLFSFGTTWGMILGSFGGIYVIWIFTAWLPTYLEMERHYSIKQTGWAAAVPFFCGVLGSLSGGWVADRLQRGGLSPVDARRYPVAVAMVGMALCVVLAAESQDRTAAIAFISATLFLSYVAIANQWSMVTVVAPKNATGSLGAIQNFGGYIGGALAPTVTGFIVQGTGSFAPALWVGAGITLAGGLAYFILARAPIEADLADDIRQAQSSAPGQPHAPMLSVDGR